LLAHLWAVADRLWRVLRSLLCLIVERGAAATPVTQGPPSYRILL
jgi:hypothetical protein